jgi:biotin operon repressor
VPRVKELTSTQASVLRWLEGGQSAPQIAELTGVSRQAVENTMNQLRERGLLTRDEPCGWRMRELELGIRAMQMGSRGSAAWVSVMECPRLDRVDAKPVGWVVTVHVYGDTGVFLLPWSTVRVSGLNLWLKLGEVMPDSARTILADSDELKKALALALGHLVGLEVVLPMYMLEER